MSVLKRHEKSLTYCTFCPSLCLHTCPVSTVEGRDTVSPWAKMSLVGHVKRGSLGLTEDVASVFYKCMGCGACTSWCVHDIDVEAALFDARALAVGTGVTPFSRRLFERQPVPLSAEPFVTARQLERFEASPQFLLFPGMPALLHTPSAIHDLLDLGERLDDPDLCLGEASALDSGYNLYAAGFLREFKAHAQTVHEALSGARQIVVMSPEDLYCLREVYPRVGLAFEGDVIHVGEYLLPLMSGAIVERRPGRVAYHDSCHLARHLGTLDVPREMLRRVLADGPIELAFAEERTVCCGGTGCLPVTSPETSLGAAERVIELALEVNAERLVTFGPECQAQLREAAGEAIRVDDVISLVNEAVVGHE